MRNANIYDFNWKKLIIPALILLGLIVAGGSYFTVPAGSVAVKLRFGKIVGSYTEGLHLKLPLVDNVDIFYHHRPDPDTPLEETMGALSQIVKSGKALYVGLSNYDGERLEEACEILDGLKCPFIINQNRYSIFDRTIENNGLKEASKNLNKGIISFSPLAQGMLTDRYLNGIPEDSRIKTDGRFLSASAVTEEKLSQIRELSKIAKNRGQTLAEMALAWVLKDGVVTSVLIGASKKSQILDNIKAINNTDFSEEEQKKMEDNFEAALHGNCFEIWYQPKVSPVCGRIVGAEALVRWRPW